MEVAVCQIIGLEIPSVPVAVLGFKLVSNLKTVLAEHFIFERI